MPALPTRRAGRASFLGLPSLNPRTCVVADACLLCRCFPALSLLHSPARLAETPSLHAPACHTHAEPESPPPRAAAGVAPAVPPPSPATPLHAAPAPAPASPTHHTAAEGGLPPGEAQPSPRAPYKPLGLEGLEVFEHRCCTGSLWAVGFAVLTLQSL